MTKITERTRSDKLRATILILIHKSEDPLTYKEISEHIKVNSPQTAQYHINILEEEGLIEKTRWMRRGILLTPTGRACAKYLEAYITPEKMIEKIGLIQDRKKLSNAIDTAKKIDTARKKSNRNGLLRKKIGETEKEIECKVSNKDVMEALRITSTYDQAAEKLGISRRSLRGRIDRLMDNEDLTNGI